MPVHKRSVDWNSDILIVSASLSNKMNKFHKFTLHWQLNVHRLTFKEEDNVFFLYCETKRNLHYLYLVGQIGQKVEPLNLSIVKGFDNGGKVDGWVSRYYTKKIPVFAANLNTNTNQLFRFITIISKNPISTEELLKCISF